MTRRVVIHCSFCGRPEHEARKLIAGPNWNFICDVCVLQCVGIVAERHPGYRAEILAELDAAVQKQIEKACRVTGQRIEDDGPQKVVDR